LFCRRFLVVLNRKGREDEQRAIAAKEGGK
jgi:hypothetical protein